MILISIFAITFCCLIIWKASDGFEAASEYLGRNLSEGVRGATINAIGSSMPELFTTLLFLFILKDKDGFAGGIGTTAGSAIFNGMIIPAAVILIVIFKRLNTAVKVSRKVLLRDGIALILCEIVLIFLIGGTTLYWWHGLILIIMYAIYVFYMLYSMKSNQEGAGFESNDGNNQEDTDEDTNEESDSFLKNLFTLNLQPIFIKKKFTSVNSWSLLIFSMLIIGAACGLLVKSCEWLGDALNIPIYFIAVILASAATSVPDTILSMKDAKKGNYDDAVSNALGSNIFDVCFALGFPLLLFTLINGPITMSQETLVNVSELRILLLILTLVAFVVYIAKSEMGRTSAFLLLLIYATFTLYILGKAFDSETANQVSGLLSTIDFYIDQLRFWN
jgi:cation:H+ antiporter